MNLVKRCIIATLAISLLALVFSCDNNAPHVHTFSEKWTSDSTHHWHAPTCDDTKEVDGKEEHKFGEGKVTKEATVDAEGEQTYTCTVCGYEKKEVIEKHKHVFSTDWSKDDDYHWHAAECGHTDAEEKIKHTFDDGVVTKEATETEEGEKTYTCTICGKTKTVKTGTSDHKHTYESTVSYDETYHWYKPTCAHTTEMKDKEKHSYDGGVTVEPTCTEDGKTTYKCTKCGYSYSETIPKKGHSFASTWSSDDEYHWHAATCEHSDAVVKEKHTFDSGTVKTEATCVADGTTTYTCSVCSKSVDKNVGKNENNHSGTLSYKYDSYLTKKSYKAQFCSACENFTGKEEGAEEGVEPLTGYWKSEKFENYGYDCIETLSFDDTNKTAVLELYMIYDNKFVMVERQQFIKYELKFAESESEKAQIEFTYEYKEPVRGEDGNTVYGEDGNITYETKTETMVMDVLENGTYNVIICSSTNPDTGIEYKIKHTKVSDNIHTEHKPTSSIEASEYLNIDLNTGEHFIPTNCDENLHEKFRPVRMKSSSSL